MLKRKKRSIDEPSPQVLRSKRKAESAGLNKGKKTKLSKDLPDPVVILVPKTISSGKSKVSLNEPSPQTPRTRKQTSETVVANKDKRIKLSQKRKAQVKNIIKKFCWICHKPCSTEICTCSRVYHSECLIKASKVFEGNTCPECHSKSVDGTELIRPFSEGLKIYLECAANWIMENNKNEVFMSWSPSSCHNKILPAIDVKTLMKKVQDNAYKRTSEFYSDVKWIHHNTCILYGEKSKEAIAAKKLVKDVKDELIDMEACPECYYNLFCKLYTATGDEDSETTQNLSYEKSFVRLCNPPHDIVWAKVAGHSHWPAKCVKIVNGKAHVRFFGKHEKADVLINTIFHISERHPVYENRNITDVKNRTSLEYTYAKGELLRYKALYEKNIGEFRFFQYREFYDAENNNFRPGKSLQHRQEITRRSSQLELPSSSNSEPSISVEPVMAVEHPNIVVSNSFSNDISVNMTFSVDNCEAEESSYNGDITSTNCSSPSNFSESNFNCSFSSTEASTGIQVKKEFSNSIQSLQISSITEQSNASSQLTDILMNILKDSSRSGNIGGNPNASDLLASLLQRSMSPTSSDDSHSAIIPVPNIAVVKEEHNICSTDSISSLQQTHELERDSTENVAAGCSSVQQSTEVEIASCSSNKEVVLVDLASEDDDDIDNSTEALANILRENPQMCHLFKQAHQSFHALLSRLCIKACNQQKIHSRQRCEAFNDRLNATEKKFRDETLKLRNEIKELRMSLASEKQKNTQVLK